MQYQLQVAIDLAAVSKALPINGVGLERCITVEQRSCRDCKSSVEASGCSRDSLPMLEILAPPEIAATMFGKPIIKTDDAMDLAVPKEHAFR